MRKTGNENDIPYLNDGIRYYEANNSELRELNQNEAMLKEAYVRAKAGESKLYFTWHGQYKTDMFEVDDLLSFGVAYGFEKSDHVHDIVWSIRDVNERGSYYTVDVEFKCGCVFESSDNIQRLKMELKSLKVWEMSKSFLCGYNGKYTVRVLKSSMQ